MFYLKIFYAFNGGKNGDNATHNKKVAISNLPLNLINKVYEYEN